MDRIAKLSDRVAGTGGSMFMNNDLSERTNTLASGVLRCVKPANSPDLKLRDPAIRCMTDFKYRVPISVAPERRSTTHWGT